MGVSNHLPCNIEDVVDLLSIPVVRSSGTQLHCRCPFCDDRKAHLNINLSKNVFRAIAVERVAVYCTSTLK